MNVDIIINKVYFQKRSCLAKGLARLQRSETFSSAMHLYMRYRYYRTLHLVLSLRLVKAILTGEDLAHEAIVVQQYQLISAIHVYYLSPTKRVSQCMLKWTYTRAAELKQIGYIGIIKSDYYMQAINQQYYCVYFTAVCLH